MMKSGIKKLLLGMWVASLLAVLIPGSAFAATKAITSVTLRVGTDAEAGDYLPDAIDISVTDSTEAQSSGTYVAINSTKYEVRDAEWVSGNTRVLTIGAQPRMKIYLFAKDVDDTIYAFRGTYSSSNVTVKGGSFVSARRTSSDELEVVVAINGIKGQYEVPASATWRSSGYGKALWNQENDYDDEYTKAIASGYYDVYLYRSNTIVKKLEDYHGTSYDFYPYMTKKGSYYYKVRSVPHTEEQKKYGKKSEWLDSDEIYIDEQHVSDGTGQVDDSVAGAGTGTVGWIQTDGFWYYRYPDGSYQKDSWLQVGGIWYLFDANGKMLTGWQTKNGRSYFLKDSGAMYTGWLKQGDMWYYMNTIADGDVEGAMRIGWLVKDDKIYYLRSNGSMAEGWTQVEGNWYYFYPEFGYKATSTTIDTFWVDENGVWKR